MSGAQPENSKDDVEGAIRDLENADDYRDPVEEESLRGYRCRACGAIFSSRKELEMHWNKAHASWRRKKKKRHRSGIHLANTDSNLSIASLRFSMLLA